MNEIKDNTQNLQQKLALLKDLLKEPGSASIAFSGGVDSTFLLKAAKDVLGEHVIAITAVSSFFLNGNPGKLSISAGNRASGI